MVEKFELSAYTRELIEEIRINYDMLLGDKSITLMSNYIAGFKSAMTMYSDDECIMLDNNMSKDIPFWANFEKYIIKKYNNNSFIINSFLIALNKTREEYALPGSYGGGMTIAETAFDLWFKWYDEFNSLQSWKIKNVKQKLITKKANKKKRKKNGNTDAVIA